MSGGGAPRRRVYLVRRTAAILVLLLLLLLIAPRAYQALVGPGAESGSRPLETTNTPGGEETSQASREISQQTTSGEPAADAPANTVEEKDDSPVNDAETRDDPREEEAPPADDAETRDDPSEEEGPGKQEDPENEGGEAPEDGGATTPDIVSAVVEPAVGQPDVAIEDAGGSQLASLPIENNGPRERAVRSRGATTGRHRRAVRRGEPILCTRTRVGLRRRVYRSEPILRSRARVDFRRRLYCGRTRRCRACHVRICHVRACRGRAHRVRVCRDGVVHSFRHVNHHVL